MDEAERIHIETLLQTHHAVLRVLEQQQAALGIMTPPNIVVQIADYREKIADLEAQLRGPAAVRKAAPRHNLPPRDYERFVGRQKELEELRRLLSPNSRSFIMTIDGIGGIGKSALALETAHSLVDEYASLREYERFEVIVWVSAKRTYLTTDGIRGRRQAFRTLEDIFVAIARVLEYPAITRSKAEEQRALVESVLREQRTLLILDNLETVDDDELLDFLHELPEPTKALITTRHRIDVARTIRLTGMEHSDALNLIEQEAWRKNTILTLHDQEQLWRRTGGVPLAIVWSIGLMGLGGSIESVLRRLSSGQNDVARFCFEESVAQIRGKDAAKLLLALSLFATDANREALGIVAGLGEDEFGRDMGLEDLLRLSLINKENDRVSLLPLTRSFVLAEATQQLDWMQAARRRWQDYFYDLAKKSASWPEDPHGHDRVELELPNILSVIDSMTADLQFKETDEINQTIAQSSLPHAQKLISFIRPVVQTCRLRGYWSECERLCYLSIKVAQSVGYEADMGWRFFDLCRINYNRDDLEAARRWGLEAHRIWEQTGPESRVCHADRMLSRIALRSGNVEEALTLLEQAIKSFEKLTGKVGGSFLEGLGEIAEKQGDLAKAMMWYQQAVAAYRKKQDPHNLAYSLTNLGRVTAASGHFEESKQLYEESLNLAQEWMRTDAIASARIGLAFVDYSQKQYVSAESNARQALDLFRRLGMKREQAEAEALLAKLTQEAQNS